MVDRDDDVKIGMKTSAITLGDKDVPAIMGFYVAYLLIWAWLLKADQQGGMFWLAWAVSAAQVVWHYFLIRHRSREGCFKAFRLNHWLGFSVFVGVVLSYL
jgi:4-hydroxybenzoate polyprenyltransferase